MADKIIRIRKKGTITIPRELRAEAEINENDYVRIKSNEKRIIIEKVLFNSEPKKQTNPK